MRRLNQTQLKTAFDALSAGAREYDHWPVAEGLDLTLVGTAARRLILADEGQLLLEAVRRLLGTPLGDLPGVVVLDVLEAFRLLAEHLGERVRRLVAPGSLITPG